MIQKDPKANEATHKYLEHKETAFVSLERKQGESRLGFYEDGTKKRIAVYIRYGASAQTICHQLQQIHYETLIGNHPSWELTGFYIDENVSGLSKNHIAFNEMISDCQAEKIDLIITKSISRFSRNVVDAIEYTRMLSALKSPVGVFFESESLYTLSQGSDDFLSLFLRIARQESENKNRGRRI